MNVVGFGDFLIHFSPIENERFIQADLMKMSFTGAEANVCAALAFWGENVQFVTKLPNNIFAKKGTMFLNSLGVKTDYIKNAQGRMGLYFLEKGYSLRPSSVVYDRQNTVFTDCKFEDFDWDNILKNVDAFYLSGITPSLCNPLLNCCEKILMEVKKRNIPVFYDVNLRPAICDIAKSREIFNLLCPYITHLISNEEHLKQLLEINGNFSDENRLSEFIKEAEKLTNIKNIAVTVRRTPSANRSIIYAAYSSGGNYALSKKREIDVVDRVGSGDAFSAGIVYSVLHNFTVDNTVEFSTISSALKHTITNDINFSTLEEIKKIMKNESCDVKR